MLLQSGFEIMCNYFLSTDGTGLPTIRIFVGPKPS
jgi:hypothetical protein